MSVPVSTRGPRRAFTLVELLTVMAIIAIIATLTALFFPNFDTRRKTASGADQLSGWLLIAKQRARRDGLPTGLRFTVTNNACNTVNYIQQPDDVAVGYVSATNGTSVTLKNVTVPLTSGSTLVQAGDYLELFGGGLLYRVTAVGQGGTTVTLTVNQTPNTPPLPTNAGLTATAPNYRIIRQAQPISGEPPLNLPDTVIIDFSVNATNGNQPLSNLQPSNSGNYDILFDQTGKVVTQKTGSTPIFLWVRDGSSSNANDLLVGNPTLIVVQPRTGFIVNAPVNVKVGANGQVDRSEERRV